MCEDMFTCQQNVEEYRELDHELNALLKCNCVLKCFEKETNEESY